VAPDFSPTLGKKAVALVSDQPIQIVVPKSRVPMVDWNALELRVLVSFLVRV